MDLKINSEKGNFKARVNGVLILNNEVLLLQMNNNGFFCCPGGHIELGESSQEAMLREMKEETGFDVKVISQFAIVENFFKNRFEKIMHELSFYYLLEPINLPAEKHEGFTLVENDKGNLIEMDFRWFDLNDLENVNVNPKVIKDKLISGKFDLEHIIFNQL